MEDGAIIHVDYDLFSGETGDLIETTREEIAKDYEMYQEEETILLWFVLSVAVI